MNNQHGTGRMLLAVMVILAFCLIGGILLILKNIGVIHIADRIIWAHFVGPYVLFTLALMVAMLKSVYGGDKQK